MRGSYTIAPNIDAFLAQVVRLAGNGYYFYFRGELKPSKDPLKLDAKLVREWQLDQPYWKREKRRRGAAPSIWYLRYKREFLLLSTHGRTEDGQAHRFFDEYGSTLKDIRKNAIYFCGYSVRYPISKATGRRRINVRLDKPTYEHLRDTLSTKAIRERYRHRAAIEAEFASLPFQPYRDVGRQLRAILREVNRRRSRYFGFEPARLSCLPNKVRIAGNRQRSTSRDELQTSRAGPGEGCDHTNAGLLILADS